MFQWLRRPSKPVALTGAPAVRRQKTYSAACGYVYLYTYEGKRPVNDGTEYVFDVTADRKEYFPVSVTIGRKAMEPWEAREKRSLHWNEEYALAKLSLFAAFDERESPALMREPVAPGPEEVSAHLDQLGVSGA